MTLRTRLIVVFSLLSVVPLGAVTLYSYARNVEAMQDVAAREADLLAGGLTDRMQLVTTQLSDRIEHVMDVSAAAPVATVAMKPVAAPEPAKPAPVAMEPLPQFNEDVANALGAAAILLNSIDMRPAGGRGGGSRDGRGTNFGTSTSAGSASATGAAGVSGARAGGQGPGRGMPPPRRDTAPPPSATTGSAATGSTTPVQATTGSKTPPPPVGPTPPPGVVAMTPPVPPGQLPTVPPATGPRIGPAQSGSGDKNQGRGQRPFDPGAFTLRFGGPGSGNNPQGDRGGGPPNQTGTQIDLSQIRRDLYRQIVPEGHLENLTPEERTRIAQEVNQRMLGVVQGIKLSALEIQKKAEEARKSTAASVPAAPKAPVAPPPPATVPATEPAAASATTQITATGLKRTAALSGNSLNVTVMRDGQVVHTANAEINLPNLLLAVFESMPRAQGEVPFAVDKDGKVYAPSDEDKKKVESLGSVATANGPIGKTVLPNWIVVTTTGPAGSGLRFGIARPLGDSLSALRKTAGRNAGFGLLLIAVALAGVVPLSGRLTRNLTMLTDGVKRIAHGDYRARVEVKTHDEVGTLATAFNQMAEDVERHQRAAVEQERIRRELELGRQIQHEMQPRAALKFGLSEITGASVSAREVGGDFFNYFQLDDGRIAMLVGDVSGKGVGAALLMANIQASLRTRLALGQSLKPLAEQLDAEVEGSTPGPLYATLFVAVLDSATRKLRYVNAGHQPPYVLRAGGGLERLSSTGMPIGLYAGHGYDEIEISLAEGDRLFFYTDGCLDAENEAEDMFGSERLRTVLSSLPPAATTQDILVAVERAVEDFRGARELFDDLTVMAVTVG